MSYSCVKVFNIVVPERCGEAGTGREKTGKSCGGFLWAVAVALGLVLLSVVQVSWRTVETRGGSGLAGCEWQSRTGPNAIVCMVITSATAAVKMSVVDEDEKRDNFNVTDGFEMDHLATCKKARSASQGWVTRAVNKIKNNLTKQPDDLIVIKDSCEEFDKRLDRFDNAQYDLEVVTPDIDLESCIDEAATFRDNARAIRVQASKVLAEAAKPALSRSHSSSISHEVKLPKIDLPKFNGDVLEWQSFWDRYSVTVHNSDIADVQKFTYLISVLGGEAKSTVQGLTITSDNYRTACDILQKRFGRKEKIIYSHILELLNIQVGPKYSIASLWKLQDSLVTHVRSLETLGVAGDQYGVILTPLILTRLPHDIRMEWAREGESHESDLEFLLTFLQKEIQRRERSQTFKAPPQIEEKRYAGLTPTAAALHNSSKSNGAAAASGGGKPMSCNLCGKRHKTEMCWDLTRRTVTDRKDKVQNANLCFKCFSKRHQGKECNAKCAKCQGRHHELLCGSWANQNARNNTQSTVIAAISQPNKAKSVLLQMATTEVCGMSSTPVNVLFDSGSDRSYVSSDIVNKINPEWLDMENLSYSAFGSENPSENNLRNIYRLNMKCSDSSSVSIQVTEIPAICTPVSCPTVPDELLQSFGGLCPVELPSGSKVKVDILIGLDCYWKLVKPRAVSCGAGLVAQDTVFGWMLSGSFEGQNPSGGENVSHQLVCLEYSEPIVKQFWDLETVGITDDESPKSVDPVHAKFLEEIKFQDDRYHVKLLWNDHSDSLMSNEKIALKRQHSTQARLSKSPDLLKRYDEALREMEQNGVIEEISEHEMKSPYPIFYIPHRPVVREDRLSTKVRPVFDASCKGYNGVSLNECMHTGPNLLPNLVEILIRFRKWKIGLSADITKAFLQIVVQREDQDVHRFHIIEDEKIRTMRFVRLPFGNRCSPFILNATIKFHLSQYPVNDTITELNENFYMDDLMTGADDDEEACDRVVESDSVMKEMSMSIAKWLSSSEVVGEMLIREFTDKCLEQDVHKVLGLKWNAALDCFMFDGFELGTSVVITKRVILSCFSRLFDPLGLLNPFTVLAKCMFQELWKLGMDWDQVVPLEYQTKFSKWLTGLKELKTWQIPRNYTGSAWRDIDKFSLHAFGDSSEQAYGACVYLVTKLKDGRQTSSLIISRARVAPVKKLTMPRLELMGSLLCARLLVFVKQALHLPVDCDYTCWTDSSCTLAWIKSDANRWKMFVANRVTEIQELTDPKHWFHCPGTLNPADLVTRGLNASEFMKVSKFWLSGPDFLVENHDSCKYSHSEWDQTCVPPQVTDESVKKPKGKVKSESPCSDFQSVAPCSDTVLVVSESPCSDFQSVAPCSDMVLVVNESPCRDFQSVSPCSDMSPCSDTEFGVRKVDEASFDSVNLIQTGCRVPCNDVTQSCNVNQFSTVCMFACDSLSAGDRELIESESLVQGTVSVSLTACTTVDKEPVFVFSRWGTFGKCMRVIAWVLRFVNNLKSKQNVRLDELTYSELCAAKERLLLCVQQEAYDMEITLLKRGKTVPKSSSIVKLSPFMGEDGLMRVGSRLKYANLTYDEKFPILLPKGHVALLLIRFQHQLLKHAGVNLMIASLRCQYWIIGCRTLAKRVKSECFSCQKQDARSCQQPMAPLPPDRITKSCPFNITGIDHAGPLYCRDIPNKKFYILLFTCGVVRALHLELVDSLNLQDTVLAFRRFVARRGLPSVVYSDNHQTFKATHVKLVSVYQHESPDWKFITPKAPWHGGWWERLVKSVKASLRKSLGSKILTRSELETAIHEVEACINSRPLTLVSDDVKGLNALTPSHFLLGKSSVLHSEKGDSSSAVSDVSLKQISDCRDKMLDHFWKIWSNEYIRNLPPWKGNLTGHRLAVGSVVLVRQEGLPRMRWLVGIIVKVYPSHRDGLIRTVDVKTVNGIYTRPIQLLYKLEVENPSNSDFDSVLSNMSNPNTSQIGPLSAAAAAVSPVSTYNETHVDTRSDRHAERTRQDGKLATGASPATDAPIMDAYAVGAIPPLKDANSGVPGAVKKPTPPNMNTQYIDISAPRCQPGPVRDYPPTDTAGVSTRQSAAKHQMPVRVAPSADPAVAIAPRPQTPSRPQSSRYGRKYKPVARM